MMELRSSWESLTRSTKVVNTDEWLQLWETTYDECQEIDLPEVQGSWPVQSFLRTLKSISPPFAETYAVKQAEGTTLDFKEVLQVYRTWYRNTHADTPRRGRGTVYLADTPSAPATVPAPSTTPTPT